MKKEILENHKRYSERVDFYRSFGYDLEKERSFIVDKSLPISGEILEIGTGKGHFVLALANRGYNFVSIDISAQEQAIAKLNIQYLGLEKQCTFKIENAEQLNFSDRSFDTVFSVNVFYHLEKPLAVLDEIIRLLRPKGKVVLSDFNKKGLEIINMCHVHEGRTHNHFKNRLDEANDYFLHKGFIVNEFQSEVQRIVIAREKQTNR